MIPTDELNQLALPDGGRIRATESYRTGITVVRFDAAWRELARFELGHLPAGFGGGGWLLSPSGRLLVLHYYSGQSEESFALLDLSNSGLKRVASPDYQDGEYGSYAFSPNEDKMIYALPRTSGDWWQAWEDDGLEVADDGIQVLPFASLFLCSTDSGDMHRTELELVPSVAQALHRGKYDPDLAPDLSAASELSIQLPWGRVTLDLSKAPSRVRLPYPSEPAGPATA